MLVTTTPNIEGKKIIDYKGLVSGEAILGANLFKDLFASITDVIGGRSGSYERELRKAKEIALEEMKAEARRLGCNLAGVSLSPFSMKGLTKQTMPSTARL